MSNSFYGQIQIFGFNFAPKDWAVCDGAQIAAQDNPALFSLLTDTYGGDLQTYFNLPNLQGRTPIGYGNYISQTYQQVVPYPLGVTGQGGATDVTLSEAQLAYHTHPAYATSETANIVADPAGGNQLAVSADDNGYVDDTSFVNLNAAAVSAVGGGGSHPNVQPFLALMFCICMQGLYPQRN